MLPRIFGLAVVEEGGVEDGVEAPLSGVPPEERRQPAGPLVERPDVRADLEVVAHPQQLAGVVVNAVAPLIDVPLRKRAAEEHARLLEGLPDGAETERDVARHPAVAIVSVSRPHQ